MNGTLTALALASVLNSPGAMEPTTPSPSAVPEPDAGRRVVVLPLQVEGTLADSWTEELRQALLHGLGDGEFDVQAAPDGHDCRRGPCVATMANEARAQGVVRSSVRAAERDYEIIIELLDADGTVVATSEESCSVCGMEEVVALVRGQAAALRGRLTRRALEPPTVEIRSTPPGAEVIIDGSVVGVTPLRHVVTPGAHRIETTRTGYVDDVQRIEATTGVRETLDVVLVLDDAPRKRRRVAGLSLAAAGVGGLVGGAVLWGLDSRPAPGERCRGDNVDADGRCRFLYDTKVAGITLSTIGVAVLATGVGLWISGRRARASTRARAPSPRLAGSILR